MTEGEVVQVLRAYFESLFPKKCTNCNRSFATLREYILETKRLGPPVSYDAELGDWNPTQPVGSAALANCSCGSTLSLSTCSMELSLRLDLLNWLKIETQKRGVSASVLLDCLRDEVRKQVLGDQVSADVEMRGKYE